jgi:hypothetical protein
MASLALLVISSVAIVALFLVLQRGEHDESEEPIEEGDVEALARAYVEGEVIHADRLGWA